MLARYRTLLILSFVVLIVCFVCFVLILSGRMFVGISPIGTLLAALLVAYQCGVFVGIGHVVDRLEKGATLG